MKKTTSNKLFRRMVREFTACGLSKEEAEKEAIKTLGDFEVLIADKDTMATLTEIMKYAR